MISSLPGQHDIVHFVDGPLDEVEPVFARLAQAYYANWELHCLLTDALGHVVAGDFALCDPCAGDAGNAGLRRRAIEESVRWGEPFVLLCPLGSMLWAVPIIHNSRVIGGLVAGAKPEAGMHDGRNLTPVEIRRAAFDLLTLAEEANLTNGALLELRRLAAQRESARAEAIHEIKEQNYQSIREIYLVEEPALISAIKSGDRTGAREIINRVLVGIYFLGRERPHLLKSFLLELVVMMSRSAVEAGGDPSELLGTNYSSFAELARIDAEEDLCEWLVAMLERIMDAIKDQHHYPISVMLGAAFKYMREHLPEELSRDEVAKVACLSPSHFSRVIKQTYGHSFTDLLAKMRVEQAKEMLRLTEKSLIQISLDCGFSDQSYFTKVFQKFTSRTPGEYRRLNRGVR